MTIRGAEVAPLLPPDRDDHDVRIASCRTESAATAAAPSSPQVRAMSFHSNRASRP
jgi:hypothetical protein